MQHFEDNSDPWKIKKEVTYHGELRVRFINFWAQ